MRRDLDLNNSEDELWMPEETGLYVPVFQTLWRQSVALFWASLMSDMIKEKDLSSRRGGDRDVISWQEGV